MMLWRVEERRNCRFLASLRSLGMTNGGLPFHDAVAGGGKKKLQIPRLPPVARNDKWRFAIQDAVASGLKSHRLSG